MFQLSIRRPQNQLMIKDNLLDTEIFRSKYDAGDNGSYIQKDGPRGSNPKKPQSDTEDFGEAGQSNAIDRLLTALCMKGLYTFVFTLWSANADKQWKYQTKKVMT